MLLNLFNEMRAAKVPVSVRELLDLINAQEELVSSTSGASHSDDIATMKKQMAQQQAEYNRLTDELAQAKAAVSDKKAD